MENIRQIPKCANLAHLKIEKLQELERTLAFILALPNAQ